jgi:hypothetical protein
VQDAYAAKGSKAFWRNNIGYYKKWGNSKGITLDNMGEGKL